MLLFLLPKKLVFVNSFAVPNNTERRAHKIFSIVYPTEKRGERTRRRMENEKQNSSINGSHGGRSDQPSQAGNLNPKKRGNTPATGETRKTKMTRLSH